MRAYQLPKGGAGVDALVKVERPDPKPAHRQIVKVKARYRTAPARWPRSARAGRSLK
jgi:hypothetical protein